LGRGINIPDASVPENRQSAIGECKLLIRHFLTRSAAHYGVPVADIENMRFSIPSLAVTLGFLLVLPQAQSGREMPIQASPGHREAVVLIGFQRGVTAAQQSAIVSGMGGIDVKTIGAGTHVVYVGQAREKSAIETLKKYREVRYVEPDFIHRL